MLIAAKLQAPVFVHIVISSLGLPTRLQHLVSECGRACCVHTHNSVILPSLYYDIPLVLSVCVCTVENEAHCDFVKLREMVLR